VGQGVLTVIGAALLILSAVTGEFGSLHLSHVSARSWIALSYLIVIGSIVAFSASARSSWASS
jgi:drug/metabolite transporter (DMT)-like permease